MSTGKVNAGIAGKNALTILLTDILFSPSGSLYFKARKCVTNIYTIDIMIPKGTPAKNNMPTESPDTEPYSINGRLGGMTIPNDEEAETIAAEYPGSYPFFIMVGIIMLPIAALVPVAVPLIAQKTQMQRL